MDTTEKTDAVQPTTAEDFRKKFKWGKVVTSPTNTSYRIRPIAPHFYLQSYSTQLLRFVPEDRKKEIQEGKELTAEELESFVPEEQRLNITKAIRPVLLEGMIEPKVIDAKAEKRDPKQGELDVDELLAMIEEATFLYVEIQKLSGGQALSGDSFPDQG